MRAKIIALPVAAGLALGGASLATAGDPPPPPKAERPQLVMPAPAIMPPHGGPLPFLPEPHPFGLHHDLAEDMAKELGLPADRVADAMRKAIGAQFDRRRDEALKCFDDREKCKAAQALPKDLMPVPVRPGRHVPRP